MAVVAQVRACEPVAPRSCGAPDLSLPSIALQENSRVEGYFQKEAAAKARAGSDQVGCSAHRPALWRALIPAPTCAALRSNGVGGQGIAGVEEGSSGEGSGGLCKGAPCCGPARTHARLCLITIGRRWIHAPGIPVLSENLRRDFLFSVGGASCRPHLMRLCSRTILAECSVSHPRGFVFEPPSDGTACNHRPA